MRWNPIRRPGHSLNNCAWMSGTTGARVTRVERPEKIVVMMPNSFNNMREELLESFEKVSDGIDIVTVSGSEFSGEEGAILAQAEVILGFCSPQLIKTAKKLHWLQHFGTGVDRCLLSPAAQEAGFILTNAQHTAGPPIAEHVIAMLMMLTRNLQYFHHMQQQQAGRGRLIRLPP